MSKGNHDLPQREELFDECRMSVEQAEKELLDRKQEIIADINNKFNYNENKEEVIRQVLQKYIDKSYNKEEIEEILSNVYDDFC